MKTTTLKPPHGWVGGKSKLAKQIVSLIPNDHLLYVEVFGGAFFFYKLQMSFGSKGDNFAMSAKSRKPKNIYKDFYKWSDRLKMVTIENMDFQKLIENYDKEEAFFYCDPPYVGTESYYKNKKTFDIDDHKRLYMALKGIKGKFLLSYNDCEFVRELYAEFRIVTSDKINYTLGVNVHNKKKEVRELFIMNY